MSTPRSVRGHFKTLGILSLAAATLLTGCVSSSNAQESSEDELTVGFPEDSANYDPHQPPQTVSRTISRQIADTLVDQDPETGEIVPWLATSWETNKDQSQFTFHLRDDVTFSDGTKFTAQSVKNNFDRIIKIGPLAYVGASHLRGYQGTDVVDEKTAIVKFDGPNAQFLQAASTQPLSILADATLKLDPEEVARGKVIGSGPYVIESYEPDVGITLKAREDYHWGSSAYANKGPAVYETVKVSFIPDATTLAGAVSSGQVDYGFLLDTSTLGTLAGQTTLVQKPTVGIASPLIPFIYRDIFKDEAVRKAINPATDRAEIAERIYQGNVQPATGVLTAATPGSADLSSELAYDPQAAVKILEAGGWDTVGEDGIRRNDKGERLEISIQYSSTGGTTEALFQLLQIQWKKVGIDFVLKPVTEAQASETGLYDAPYDLTTWSQGRADPDVLRVVYSSLYENQSLFYGNAVPAVDKALLKLQSTTDAQQRKQASAEAQQLLLDKGLVFPLVDQVSNSAYGKDIKSIELDAENKPAFAEFVPNE
ncbi:ABC transporter substrate-binding protein [Glutamicibacter uratoxydans]|uniref:ABC transporter substrate-binding protein n=1 Tax=Glutamicibacter uratoxydans TaxID=43667 RepID=A0A4Y4DSY6_GLUUR|nr:ABC transporter substrate-binding protein [Glutamicibacter uratoxydans]GED07747.1 ABC transporter substrate-binding protein [Glutamicibacter uratoxydans]